MTDQQDQPLVPPKCQGCGAYVPADYQPSEAARKNSGFEVICPECDRGFSEE